jgi:hypothetical protein
MAPELIDNINQNKDKMFHNSYKSDVFSLGLVILYYITNLKFYKDLRKK